MNATTDCTARPMIGAPMRVRFVSDNDYQFEECNGEPRPLSEVEYASNEYWGCPQHPRGTTANDTTVNGVGICGACGAEYAPIPYAEYLAYYGNPDRHVYLGLQVQESCACCHEWREVDSLWGIDFMDDSPELAAINVGTWIDGQTARALPGHVGALVRDYVKEAQP